MRREKEFAFGNIIKRIMKPIQALDFKSSEKWSGEE